MIEIAGYFLSLLIGLSLGLVGGGGSILAIPVLVFFFDINPVLATTYSLFIVGLSAISGSIHHYRMHNIDYKIAVLFGVPSVIVLFIMRKWVLALIPPILFYFGEEAITKPLFIMIIFSIVMLVAGWSMIRSKRYAGDIDRQSYTRLILLGCVTGAITGFIGVGGGFIIVPSLVLFAGLPLKNAIGTSLCIITVNCLVGILGNLQAAASLDYFFLSVFSALAIIGILIGSWMLRFIPDRQLKPALGWIILGMSIIVFIRIFMQHY